MSCQNFPPVASTARWLDIRWKAPSRIASTPRLPQHPARQTTESYPLRRPRWFMTSMGFDPLSISTLTPRSTRRCFRSCVFCISLRMNAFDSRAASWHLSASSAARSALPDSMASWASREASAADSAAWAAAWATAMAMALSPCRSRTRDAFLPSAFQNASTSTPGGRLGSSFVSGRSSRSVVSMTSTRSTPAGSDLPCVHSHWSPLSLAWTDGSSTGPFPGAGNVATTASTLSYHGIMRLLSSPPSPPSNAPSTKKSSTSCSISSSPPSSTVAHMLSGGGAISYVPKSR
mmetsp:Transcript_24042/g.56950  ORF Transcript_24042/g.56950 Transcript_24042/m.56950 type:complete len:290 (+) Transcript_24042:349-1218(+)